MSNCDLSKPLHHQEMWEICCSICINVCTAESCNVKAGCIVIWVVMNQERGIIHKREDYDNIHVPEVNAVALCWRFLEMKFDSAL